VDGTVIERLLAEPGRYGFFQAMRLLLAWLEGQGVPARQAWLDHLRFPNSVAMGFPAAEIEAVVREALPAAPAPRFSVTPAFMGLLGAHGALPWHDTERIVAHEAGNRAGHEADLEPDRAAARAFLDIFSTRMLALFYEAWSKYRTEHLAGREADGLLPILLALAGLAPGLAHDGVPDAALALHAGALRARPLGGAMLARVLAAQLHVPVAVDEAVGHWDRLAPPERNALGRDNTELGRSMLLGERGWRPDLRVRVRLGPLDRARFERFRPGAPGMQSLAALLRLFAPLGLSYEVVLVLRREDVAPLDIAAGSRRLGLDSYLVTGPVARHRADLRYVLRPLRPLS
jgi:type VI secretion system protein ImpH